LETLYVAKRYGDIRPWRLQVLNGNKIGEDATGAAVAQHAETALALMGTACGAIKERRWDEAEEMLKALQSMVHQLRVDVRDKRFPFELSTAGIPEG
jgi:hypothetical protein